LTRSDNFLFFGYLLLDSSFRLICAKVSRRERLQAKAFSPQIAQMSADETYHGDTETRKKAKN